MKKRRVQIIKDWIRQEDGSYISVEKTDPKKKQVVVFPGDIKLHTDRVSPIPMPDPKNILTPPVSIMENNIDKYGGFKKHE